MYMFNRTVTTVGAPADILAFSVEMAAYASETTGREVALWTAVFGAPVGTMSYVVRVDGLDDLRTRTNKMIEDPAYHAKLAKGQAFAGGPTVDSLAQPIHGEMGDPPPVGSYAMVTRATMAGGKYVDGIEWGVEIAQHVEKISGVPTMFLSSAFGSFGDVAWIGVVRDAAAVDTAMQAINGDADYITSVNGAGDLFIPGSGHQSLVTRVA